MFRRRNKILINPQFQLRFSFYIVTWMIPMMVVFPLITYELFEYLIRFVSKLSILPDVTAEIWDIKREVISLIVLAELSFVFALFLINLWISHRIAGPIYKIRQLMGSAAQGDLQGEVYLRKSDHFKELAHDYNRLIHSIREARTKDVDSISQAIARVESAKLHVDHRGRSELEESLKDLQLIRERLSC